MKSTFNNVLQDTQGFYMFPRSLLLSDKYNRLSNNAKLLFMLLTDRAELSKKNGLVDKHGKVMVFMTNVQTQKILHIGHNTVCKIYKELEMFNLIERHSQGFGKAFVIYPKTISVDR